MMAEIEKPDGRDDDPSDPSKIPMYLSPYEVWNFGAGKGYAFPSIRKFSRFITALAELAPLRKRSLEDPDDDDPNDEGFDDARAGGPQGHGRRPTLWKPPKPHKLTFIPFVAEGPVEVKDSKQLLEVLGDALGDVVDRGVFRIKKSRFRVAFPVPDKAMKKDEPTDPYWKPDGELRGRIGEKKKIVIMAVIDDGMPFAHRHFRDASGQRSRVEFCWLQSVVADDGQKSVLFGREYIREQIEHFIKQHGDDEDTLYRAAGATADTEDGALINRQATHGAHVMDLATGYAPERGEDPAEEIRIIAVQLPNTITLDTSGIGKDMYMLSAFHYIFHRADMIASKAGYDIDQARLVINFSYGFAAGRHDGETELEAAIDEMIRMRRTYVGPTALVLPAGNMFLDRMHGAINKKDLEKDGTAAFCWRLQANDRTPSYLEMWFAEDFDPVGDIVELWDPSGNLTISFKIEPDLQQSKGDPAKIRALFNHQYQQVGQISADEHRSDKQRSPRSERLQDERAGYEKPEDENPWEKKTGRWRVLIVMAPSEPEDDSLPRIDAGNWTVVFKRRQGARLPTEEYPIRCWVQRDADPEMLRAGGRQSYFDDRNDVRYDDDGSLRELDTEDAFVKRFGSLSGLATAATSLVVAGFRLGLGLGSALKFARPAPYSSAGTGKKEDGWPDVQIACSSMSDRSKVLAGTVAAGVRSGSRSFVQGTSAAAPFVARRLATIFVDASNHDVKTAEHDNYRPLLLRDYCHPAGNAEPAGEPAACENEYVAQADKQKRKARLGTVLVPPHWQPSLECRQEEGARCCESVEVVKESA